MSRRAQLSTTAIPNEDCFVPRAGAVPAGEPYSPPQGPAPGQSAEPGSQSVRTISNATFREYPYVTKLVSEQVIPDNYRRAYLAIQNRGASAIFLGFGRQANENQFRLVAGGFYEPYIAPRNSLHILGVAAGDTVVIIEGDY